MYLAVTDHLILLPLRLWLTLKVKLFWDKIKAEKPHNLTSQKTVILIFVNLKYQTKEIGLIYTVIAFLCPF